VNGWGIAQLEKAVQLEIQRVREIERKRERERAAHHDEKTIHFSTAIECLHRKKGRVGRH